MQNILFAFVIFIFESVASTAASLVEEAAKEFEEEVKMVVNQDNCHVKAIVIAGGLVVGGVALGYFLGQRAAQKKAHVNPSVKKDTDKVVDTVDMEDIGEKKVFCRCWRSSKFPYCDGTHNKHNTATGDNVGPLIVKGEAK